MVMFVSRLHVDAKRWASVQNDFAGWTERGLVGCERPTHHQQIEKVRHCSTLRAMTFGLIKNVSGLVVTVTKYEVTRSFKKCHRAHSFTRMVRHMPFLARSTLSPEMSIIISSSLNRQ